MFSCKQVDAVGNIVLPTVPRTGYAVALQLALSDRATLMGAHAIGGVDHVATAEDCDDLLAHQKLLTGRFGQII